jgi:hypothetical protein
MEFVIFILLGLGIIFTRWPILAIRVIAFPSILFINVSYPEEYPIKENIEKVRLLYSDEDEFRHQYPTYATKMKWYGVFLFVFAGLLLFIELLRW